MANCPRCEHVNRPERRFCGNCGQKLDGACPECGFRNDPQDRFCGGCGRPTGNAASLPDSSDGAERRHLTIMFCDLVGSTALSESMDPEDLRECIAAFRDLCTSIVEGLGGFVARNMGDGLLVYFGYPRAYGNDAERSVRAGLRILDEVPALNSGNSQPLQVRVGIASGLSVVGDLIGEDAARELAVLGNAPNLAARLQGTARPGQLLIAPETRELAGDRFRFKALPAIRLKGISDPVIPYLVKGQAAAAAPDEDREPAAFVGRREELDTLRAHWAGITGSGSGRVIILSGVAGIGKSRLCAEFRRIIGQDATALELACSAFRQTSAFYPLRKLASRLLEITPQTPDDAFRARLDREIEATDGQAADGQSPFLLLYPDRLGQPEGQVVAEGARTRQWLFEILAGMILRHAGNTSLLLLVEDIQWADPSTRGFVEFLARDIADRPLLLLITQREEDGTGSLTVEGRHHIALTGLTPEDSRQLLDASTGPDAGLTELVDRAGGIPLYLEELALASRDSGNGDKDAAIPPTLQDLLTARLDRLGDARKLVQMAAVLGRSFTTALLQRAGEIAGMNPVTCLTRLLNADILTRSADGETCTFRHSLIQEAAYTSLLKKTRWRYHGFVADVLQEAFAQKSRQAPEILARHLQAAERLGAAAETWQRAGGKAATTWATQEAVTHLEASLHCATAAEDFDPLHEMEIRIDLAAALRLVDRNERAREVLGPAERTALKGEYWAHLARIQNLQGNLDFASSALGDCREHHSQALGHARKAGDRREEAHALSGLGDANLQEGRMRSAEKHIAACAELCRSEGLDRLYTVNLALQGHMRVYLARLPEARADCQAAIRLARTHNFRRAEMIARGSCLAKALVELGEAEEALEELAKALDIARALGAQRFIPLYSIFQARAFWMLGRRDDANDAIAGVLDMNADTPSGYTTVMGYGAAALVGRGGKARRDAIEKGLGLITATTAAHNHLWFYRDAMEAALDLGDQELALRMADGLEDFCRLEPLPWCDRHIEATRHLAAPSSKNGGELATRLRQLELHPLAARLERTVPV